MKLLKQIFDFYLDASVHTALAVIALYCLSLKILEASTNTDLFWFLFFGTIVCYNFIKYGVEAKKYLIVSNPYHKLIQIFSFLSSFAIIYFFVQLQNTVWIIIVALTFIAGLYAVPLLPSTKNLRSLGGMKIFLVAVVWMGCSVLLPTIDLGLPITFDIIILMIQRVLLVLILLMPFEIRDLQFDDIALKTLPQRFGIQKTKLVSFFLIGIYVILTLFKEDIDKRDVFGYSIFGIILFLVISLTKEKQPKYFASFWVEALPIVFLGIWYLLELLV